MAPNGLSVNALAASLYMSPQRVHDIVRRHRATSPETSLRLARYFGSTAEFWAGLQTGYALRMARGGRSRIERDIQSLST